MEKTLEIKGMMCPHCEATVHTALEAMPQRAGRSGQPRKRHRRGDPHCPGGG